MGHISREGAQEDPPRNRPLAIVGVVASLCMLAGGLFVTAWFVAAFAADASGLGLPASVALLAMLGGSVAGLVGWARRVRVGKGEAFTTPFLGEAARVCAVVLGALLASAFAAFYVGGLLLALADRGRLPVSLATLLIEVRRSGPPMGIPGVIWLVLTLGWSASFLAAVVRGLAGELVSRVFYWMLFFLGLAFSALVAIFLIGPG